MKITSKKHLKNSKSPHGVATLRARLGMHQQTRFDAKEIKVYKPSKTRTKKK